MYVQKMAVSKRKLLKKQLLVVTMVYFVTILGKTIPKWRVNGRGILIIVIGPLVVNKWKGKAYIPRRRKYT